MTEQNSMSPAGISMPISRRSFTAGMAAALVATLLSARARANVPVPYDWNATPPMGSRAEFVAWMQTRRGEDPLFLGERWDRFQAVLARHDIWSKRDMRAFLLTPRELFVTKANLARAYEWHYLDIGFGVTITGPHTVARMTNSLDVQQGEKVLEIGTGSGYQSAYLANLTDKVWTIEIIKPLAERTRRLYDALIARGYSEYRAITTRNADGYYGSAENAPFDKIIVTCAIDHVPPPLLQQLKPNGIIVIPIGPPGAQHVLKIVKQQMADGSLTIARSDIYHGATISFVPFTR
jgi:protein-L-isoaspartate(D-aspartate) O-methyltransferase